MSAPAVPGPRRGGPPVVLAALAIASLALGALLVVAQLLGVPSGTAPRATPAPPGDASALACALAERALGAASFTTRAALTPYRPGETPELAARPRRVLEIVVPAAAGGVFVACYDLPSAAGADAAGRELVAYLASGTGAIQYPADARFVVRRQGSALLLFAWSPAADREGSLEAIDRVLSTVGVPLTGG